MADIDTLPKQGLEIVPDHSVLDCMNPATGEIIEKIPVTTVEEIQRKIIMAREASQAWGRLTLRQRAKVMKKAQKALVARMDEIVEIVLDETGKTDFDGVIEMLTTLEIMRFNRKMAPRVLASEVRP